jgi:hypothetical protein
MRRTTIRIVTMAMLLFIAQLALSVEVSEAKLAELVKILESYNTITKELSASLQSSKTRIDDLQSGFKTFKETVDLLVVKAKRQECELRLWRIVGISALVSTVGVGIWAILK